MLKRFKKLIAVISLFALSLQSLGSPFLLVKPTFAQEQQNISSVNAENVSFSFDSASHEFNLTVNSDKNLSYIISYEKIGADENTTTEAVIGKLTPNNGTAQTTVFAGTCSSGTCIEHNFTKGNLKITAENDQNTVFFDRNFTYENGQINFERTDEITPTDPITPTLTITPPADSFNRRRPLKNDQFTFSTIDGSKHALAKEVLVKFKESSLDLSRESLIDKVKLYAFEKTQGVQIAENLNEANVSVVKVDEARETAEELAQKLEQDPNVEYAEPNYKHEIRELPINTNDPLKDNLWALYNTGQTINGTIGTNDADIDAPDAWQITEGDPSVIVAVIDTGVAYNHPDLINNMWDGSNCVNESGITIPGGCKHGYDFEDNDNDPLPTSSYHGTHVAGTIAASKNNSYGIVGVAPNVKIMAVKTSFTYSNLAQAIDFARQNGAKVMNASYGGYFFSQTEHDAIERFQNAGGIFIAAAGNDTNNNDAGYFYPSGYDLPAIVSVAATTQTDNIASFSNYGASSVDVGAPGVNIQSSIPGTSTSTVFFEDFESVAYPNLPSGWINNGRFGVFPFTISDKVLYADANYPYSPNSNYTVVMPNVNLSSAQSAVYGFKTYCDTEYNSLFWTDYLALEATIDGNSYFEVTRWDEYSLDKAIGDSDPNNYNLVAYDNFPFDQNFLSSNFRFRLHWISNASNYGTTGDGCMINDFYIKSANFSDGSDNQYTYLQGTSMAAPHVAGLAALILSYKPTLTNTEVKNVILTTGDDKASLAGKTVTGKRINAYGALSSLVPAPNQPPVAIDDNFNTNEDTALHLTASQLLTNDTDPDNSVNELNVVSVGNNINGAIYKNENDITFTPTPDFNGSASFEYTVSDPDGLTDTGKVNVTVNSVNDAPFLQPIPNRSVIENDLLVINLSATDNDNSASELIYYGTNMPLNSSLNGPVFTFQPDETQGGNDYTITFTVSDGSLTHSQTTTIIVNEVNEPPVAVDDYFVVYEDYGIAIQDAVLTNNDQDAETVWPNFTVSELKNPIHGTVEWLGKSTAFFNPDPNFHGTGSFDYTLVDEGGLTDTGTVYITVKPVNDAPILYPIGDKNVDEFSTLNFTVVGSDVDNTSLILSSSTIPANSTFDTTTGEFSFTPDETQGGQTYQITFTISDGSLDASETITITVNEVNNAPVAINDSASVNEDEVLTIDPTTLFANDTDPDTDHANLSLNSVSNPINGTVAIDQNGDIVFTPDANFNGQASFDYTVIDDTNLTDSATVHITVNAVNDAPILDSVGDKNIDEYALLTIHLTASDVDNTNLIFSGSNIPNNSNLTPAGEFNFRPDETQGGRFYTVTFSVSDGSLTDSETIRITVNEVNNAPIAHADSASVNEDEVLNILPSALLANDTDVDNSNNELNLVSVSNPVNGTVSLDQSGITFTPDLNFNGSASFEYTVSDPGSLTDQAVVNITVTPVNDKPVVSDQNVSVVENHSVNITLGDETDIDGDWLIYSITSGPLNGVLTLIGNQAVYTATAGFTGLDEFDFMVDDTNGSTDSAKIFITVFSNNAPIAVDQNIEIETGSSANITLSASDAEGDTLTYTITNQPQNGVLSGTAPDVVYTPNADFIGTDSFAFTASDGQKDSNEATITITVKEKQAEDNNDSGSSDSGNSNNSGSNNSSSSYSCSDSKPEGKPALNASLVNSTSVKLNWNQVQGPVTNYALIYTDNDGNSFGNTNIGNTTEFTVNSLVSGKSYNFEIMPVNGCATGEVSNKASITMIGGQITPAAAYDDQSEVLSSEDENTENNENQPSEEMVLGENQEQNKDAQSNSLFKYIAGIMVLGIIFLILKKRFQK